MIRQLNAWRWRLARLFAPDPILAQPSGDGEAYILLILGPDSFCWIQAASLDLNIESAVQPLGDPFALGTWSPPRSSRWGKFSGTIH